MARWETGQQEGCKRDRGVVHASTLAAGVLAGRVRLRPLRRRRRRLVNRGPRSSWQCRSPALLLLLMTIVVVGDAQRCWL
jgi:hypothetical protein